MRSFIENIKWIAKSKLLVSEVYLRQFTMQLYVYFWFPFMKLVTFEGTLHLAMVVYCFTFLVNNSCSILLQSVIYCINYFSLHIRSMSVEIFVFVIILWIYQRDTQLIYEGNAAFWIEIKIYNNHPHLCVPLINIKNRQYFNLGRR